MFESLGEKLINAFNKFRSKGKLTVSDVKEGMREVKLALLEADVNFKVVKDFVKNVTERAVGAEVLESLLPAQQVIKIVNEELTALMGGSQSKLEIAPAPPTVILMCGLQGAGKTTHAGKLAGLYKKQGKSRFSSPATCTALPLSSSSRWSADSLTFPFSRWAIRSPPSASRKKVWLMRRRTALTWCSSTPPADFTLTKRS